MSVDQGQSDAAPRVAIGKVTSVDGKQGMQVKVVRAGTEHTAQLLAHTYTAVTVGVTVVMLGMESGASTTWAVIGVMSAGGEGATPLGPELIANPDLDMGEIGTSNITSWDTSWAASPVTLSDTEPLTGAACVRMSLDGNGDAGLLTRDAMQVTPGARYSASCFYRGPSNQQTPMLQVLTGPTPEGANYFGDGAMLAVDAAQTITSPGTWQSMLVPFTVAAGHNYARLAVRARATTPGDVFFDSASLRQQI